MHTPRRCAAYHPNGLRCNGDFTASKAHDYRHWATTASGDILQWDDHVAVTRQQYLDNSKRAIDPTERYAAAFPEEARLNQVGGEHYRKFKIQPWDVIDEYGLSFYAGGVLKYLLRAGNKGPALEDLRKARHYLDKLIEVQEKED